MGTKENKSAIWGYAGTPSGPVSCFQWWEIEDADGGP